MMKNTISIVLLGAALSACGGGSDGGAPEVPVKPPVVVTPPVVPADSVTLASQAVAKEAGLNIIAGASADESVYDVAADIGDTWRITFDSVKKTYAIRVLSTQFGLSDRSGTFSASTSGNLTTYTDTATDFSVTVDARTRLLSGNIKLGNMVSTVSGSGYAVSDVAKLAGNYISWGPCAMLRTALSLSIRKALSRSQPTERPNCAMAASSTRKACALQYRRNWQRKTPA
ncbi:hypothetical protein BA896_004605 [Janthinobacterium lividum]|uniref:Lipoprotein n=1 Tax=Janthinobacterium lividum TaxID=29581 RepID=A0A1E8PRU4_9BURK|nr:hypothetical protein BA896_004605 [Janthinobacterium lividum]